MGGGQGAPRMVVLATLLGGVGSVMLRRQAYIGVVPGRSRRSPSQTAVDGSRIRFTNPFDPRDRSGVFL